MSKPPAYSKIALGIGSGVALAFGLTAMRRKRLAEAEERAPNAVAEVSDPTVFDCILSSFESRLQQHLGEMQHRIANVEGRVEMELNRMEAERIRFGRASQETEQRVREQTAAHMLDLERRLNQMLTETSTKMAELLVHTIETRVVDRITMLEETIGRQNEVIRTLRERSAGAEQNMQELVAGFGDAFHSALNHLKVPRNGELHEEPRKWRAPLASGM